MAGTDNNFAYKMLIFSMVIMLTMPMMFGIFGIAKNTASAEQNEILDGYYNFTGSKPTSESVWALTGIYTPYEGGQTYAYTEDGWLYSERVQNYTPSQYQGVGSEPDKYVVSYDKDRRLYTYKEDTPDYNPDKGIGHKQGDVYTDVSFSRDKKSNIFFTEAMKETQGDFFYYRYNGYRYSFQPLTNYDAAVNKGSAESPVWESVPVVANTTSLSLIWYEYYTSDGIAGQLVISGSDKGVAFITSDTIIRAFNSITSTAKFLMNFNGIDMNIYIKLDPSKLADGMTVKNCYDYGYWSVMVTSQTTETDAYTNGDYAFNVQNVLQTVIDLMTFHTQDYGIEGWQGTLCSFVIVVPLYAALISIGLTCLPVLIFAGALAAVQGIASAIQNFNFF